MAEAPATFAAQMKKFFGFKEGQKLADFMAELKALDGPDREYFTELLNGAGYPVTASTTAAK